MTLVDIGTRDYFKEVSSSESSLSYRDTFDGIGSPSALDLPAESYGLSECESVTRLSQFWLPRDTFSLAC